MLLPFRLIRAILKLLSCDISVISHVCVCVCVCVYIYIYIYIIYIYIIYIYMHVYNSIIQLQL